MDGTLQMEIRRDMSELSNQSEPIKKKEQLRTTVGKARVLEALEKTMGISTPALKAAGIGKTQFNKWKKDDPEFMKKVSEVMNLRLDFLENEALSRIQNKEQGSNTLIMYMLNNKGRERGYGDDRRIDITSKGNELLAPSWVLEKQKPTKES